jgi:hypothetical protein
VSIPKALWFVAVNAVVASFGSLAMADETHGRTGDSVYVHLEGSDAAELQQDVGDEREHWVTVCHSPCDQTVSPGDYRIGGAGIRRSHVFWVDSRNGDRQTFVVNEASKGDFVLGIVGMSIGFPAMIVGLLVVSVGAAENTLGEDGGGTETAGGIIAGAGAFVGIGGIVMTASNAHSGVSRIGSESAAAQPGSPWAHVPSFRDNRDVATRAFPAAVGVPLFGGQF